MDTTRKTWGNPRFEVQQFIPQEYCEYCFQFSIVMHCVIDSSRTGTYEPGYNTGYGHYHQYEYCGDNWIKVTITDGVPHYDGYENATHEGEGAPQDVRSVTNITPNILTLNEGDDITYGEWQSFYSGLEFNHHGNGKVLSKDMTWEGHPNHS